MVLCLTDTTEQAKPAAQDKNTDPFQSLPFAASGTGR
jgi:hypothetical protein